MGECDFLNTSELERRAKICRVLAAGECHPTTKRQLLEIADKFEELAHRLSGKLRPRRTKLH